MSQYIFPYQQMSLLAIVYVLHRVPHRELANVCIGKCSIYISKCHKNQPRQKIGKCLDQQMTYQQMYRLANVELANVAQQMSGQQMSNWRMTAHRFRLRQVFICFCFDASHVSFHTCQNIFCGAMQNLYICSWFHAEKCTSLINFN